MEQDENEVFEKIPEFIIDTRRATFTLKKEPELPVPEIVLIKAVPENTGTEMTDLEIEQQVIRQNLSNPSTLRIELSQTLVDFDGFKGEIPELFRYLSYFFQIINKWNEDAPIKLSENLPEPDIYELLNKLAYIPNNKYFGNALELLAAILENGIIELGSVMDTEIIFQGFKRVYNKRTQAILLPLLFNIFTLNKKLVPLKKIAWQLLNKNGRNCSAALIMDDIQKSNVRIKKSQELLTQESYNFEQKLNINIDLLLVLTDKNSVFFPVYQVYKELINEPELDVEVFLSKAYELDNIIPKPISQQLLTYKTGKTGETVTAKIMRWSGRNSEPEFKQFLHESFRDILYYENIYARDFYLEIREVIFATMDIARKRSWSTSEVIKDIVFAVLVSVNLTDLNKLKIVSYCLGSEVIAGVLKVKYRIDEAVQGLAKGIVNLLPAFDEGKNFSESVSGISNKREFFSNNTNYKIISEYVYSGVWDTLLEAYPNFLTIEKHADLFVTTLKTEAEALKTRTQEQSYKAFERNV